MSLEEIVDWLHTLGGPVVGGDAPLELDGNYSESDFLDPDMFDEDVSPFVETKRLDESVSEMSPYIIGADVVGAADDIIGAGAKVDTLGDWLERTFKDVRLD